MARSLLGDGFPFKNEAEIGDEATRAIRSACAQRHVFDPERRADGRPELRPRCLGMLGHLHLIDPLLGESVERALRMEGKADRIEPARPPIELPPAPSLSLLHKATDTLKGRRVGVLISDDSDVALLDRLRSEVEAEGAEMTTIAPWVGGVKSAGRLIVVDHALVAAPSIFFDAVALVLNAPSGALLAKDAAAVDFVRDAFGHLKVIGYTSGAAALLAKAGISDQADEGVVSLAVLQSVGTFVGAAKRQRVWAREPAIRAL